MVLDILESSEKTSTEKLIAILESLQNPTEENSGINFLKNTENSLVKALWSICDAKLAADVDALFKSDLLDGTNIFFYLNDNHLGFDESENSFYDKKYWPSSMSGIRFKHDLGTSNNFGPELMKKIASTDTYGKIDKNEVSALQSAIVRNGSTEGISTNLLVLKLISKCTTDLITKTTDAGDNMLHLALKHKCAKGVISAFINLHPDMVKVNSGSGDNVFHLALKSEYDAAMIKFIHAKLSKDAISAKDSNGDSALHLALKHSCWSVIDLFEEEKDMWNEVTSSGANFLHLVFSSSKESITTEDTVDSLVKWVAENEKHELWTARDKHGHNPVYYLAGNVNEYIDLGYSLNKIPKNILSDVLFDGSKDVDNKASPIEYAAVKKNTRFLKAYENLCQNGLLSSVELIANMSNRIVGLEGELEEQRLMVRNLEERLKKMEGAFFNSDLQSSASSQIKVELVGEAGPSDDHAVKAVD